MLRRRVHRWAVALCVLHSALGTPALGQAGATSAGPADPPPPAASRSEPDGAEMLTLAQRIFGLSTIWQEVNYNFAYFDQVPALDWDSLYRAFIPRVIATESTYEYYRELQRFMVPLGDAHTRLRLPRELRERYDIHYPWVLTRNVDGDAVVRNVGRSLAEVVPVGSVIHTVDGAAAADHASEHQLPYVAGSTEYARWDDAVGRLLYGDRDTPVTIGYVTPDGRRETRRLMRDRRTRPDEWLLPTSDDPFEFRWLADGIAYVALNTFNDTAVVSGFEAVLDELAGARALVVDVRRNGGGSSSNGYRILSYLTDDTLATSSWKTRQHVAAYKAWGLRGGRYAEFGEMRAWLDGGTHGTIAPARGRRLVVPTVVLQDHDTYSAAEDFLVVLDAMPHVTTVGRPSNGSTGQPLFFDLPGGGSAQVVTKRDTYPDGRDFVGIGIQPDVVVSLTVEDVVRGRDPQLDRGVELLQRILAQEDGDR